MNRLIFLLISLVFSNFGSKSFGQRVLEDKVLFSLISQSDSVFINAKKIFLVNKAIHFYAPEYIYPLLKKIDFDTTIFNSTKFMIDSLNRLSKNWNFKNRKLKIYPNDKAADKALRKQLNIRHSKSRYVKFIRFGCSQVLYCNNLYLISYWHELGGLSRRLSVAVLKINNDNKFELIEIYDLPGGS